MIRRLYSAGRIQDAVGALRRRRCRLMDAMHESQNRVDRLDLLVYQLQKQSPPPAGTGIKTGHTAKRTPSQ